MTLAGRPATVLAVVVAVTALCAWDARVPPIAADLEGQLRGHPAHAGQEEFRRLFGAGESIAASLPIERLDAASMGELHEVVQRLENNPAVVRVVSLLDLLPRRYATARELIEALSRGRTLERFVDGLDRYRTPRGLTISGDRRALGLLIALRPHARGRGPHALVSSIETDIAAVRRRRGFSLLGYPVVERRVIDLVRDSHRRFTPIGIAGGLVILAVVLGSLRLVTLAALSVFAPLVWLLWLMGIFLSRLTSFSTMLFPLMLTVGLTNTLYVMSAHMVSGLAPRGGSGAGPGGRSDPLGQVLVPQLLCGVTTCIGFLSLTVTGIPIVREFGVWAAIGSALALAATLTVVPAGMGPGGSATSAPLAALDHALDRLGRGVLERRRWVAALWLATVAVAAAGVTRIVPASSATAFLLDGDPVMEEMRSYSRSFAPATWVELVVHPWPFPADHPETVARIHHIACAVGEEPLVDSTVSIADLLLDAGARISGRRLDSEPTVREWEIYRRFVAAEGLERALASFVSTDRSAARILVRLRTDEAFAVVSLARRIEARVRPMLRDRERAFVTGLHYLSSVVHADGVQNEVTSLVGSVAGGLAALGVVLRSPGIMLVLAIPNVVPLLVVYGLMGWVGRSLDLATGVVGPVMFGMLVDDTTHVVYRFRAALAGGALPREAFERTIADVGRPVVMNALTLMAGLGLAALAPFAMSRTFGLWSAMTVAIGLACDLTLTPLILMRFPGLAGPRAAAGPGPVPDARSLAS